MKYYVCEHCGNIIEYINETGVPVMCCGQKMQELTPGKYCTIYYAVFKYYDIFCCRETGVFYFWNIKKI